MCDLKWVEVDPEQNDWEIQYDLVAYDGNVTIGSIVYLWIRNRLAVGYRGTYGLFGSRNTGRSQG